MASYQDHIQQAKRNLLFLQKINSDINDCTDWQVTVCYYSALHFLNAYLAKEGNLHYNKHRDIEQTLNWSNQLSVLKLTENDFTTYQQLRNLSRRSRYLCTDGGDHSGAAQPTREKQLSKAIICVDKLIHFFVTKYTDQIIDITEINCPTLLGEPIRYFKIKKPE